VEELDIKVNWIGFELHPETPVNGKELKPSLSGDIPSEQDNYIQQFADRFGVQGMKSMKRMPNTRRALAIAEFARDHGQLDEYHRLVMDAQWIEGNNIEDNSVLAALAKASGLDPEKALLATDDPTYLGRVDTQRVEYKKLGVGGIPTFVFGSESIEGFRPYNVLTTLLLRAGAKRR